MSTALARPTGLTWTVLRLHRLALWLWIAYVAVAAGLLLWLWGPGTNGLPVAERCLSGAVSGCSTTGAYSRALNYLDASLTAVPLAAAVFAGGVLVGRELERGTAQLAWTQSVTPARWLAAKLAVPALLLTVGTGLLVVLRHAVAARARGMSENTWWSGAYDVLGPTAVVLPLAGLACGAVAALLQRKLLPAAVLGALLTLLLATCATLLHPHLWATRTVVGSLAQGYRGYTGEGVDEGAVTSTGAHISDPICVGHKACLADHDVVGFYSTYHPASHFWPLQLMETGVLLLLTAAMTYLAFRILQRRVPA
ncbi:ABC transporter permease [Streptomyces sp. SID14478]|uniref:ABC transporter permease n=1 Tax=Streptomyces sp. SID14478 TaxID=2706073 RepID=UPI0013DEDB60|nr:ABC transporter permease [Streptomyces sp. SID14478]NEB80764.1 ABC transporter permease [Streptomyces sp. SID14478]